MAIRAFEPRFMQGNHRLTLEQNLAEFESGFSW